MTNLPATKVFSARARASALAVRRHQSALGASDKPGGAPVAMGGMMVSPAIAARVKQILAEKAKGKTKKAAHAKKGPDPAKEKAARVAKAAAAKQEREKAKMARDLERTGKQAAREETRKVKVAERAAAAQKKQAAAQAKLKAAAGKAKAKAGAAKGKAKAKVGAGAAPSKEKATADNRAKVAKDMAAQDAGLSPSGSAALSDFADGKPLKDDTAKEFASMGLVETGSDGQHRLTSEGRAAAAAMSKGDTRGAIDAISRAADKKKQAGESEKKRGDAQASRDKAKADATAKQAEAQAKRDASAARVEAARIEAARSRKAWDMYAIKQSDEERAMFAKMGGRRGKGKGYDKSKSTLKDDKAKGGGGGESVNPAFAPTGHPSRAQSYSPSALEAHARSGKESFLGFEHENGLRVSIETNTNRKGTNVRGTHRVTVHQPNGSYTEHQTNNSRIKNLGQQLKDRGMIYVSPHVSLSGDGSKAIEDTDMDDLDLDNFAIKISKRNAKADQEHLDTAALHLHAAGATCPDCAPGDDEPDEDAAKAIKSIMDDPGYFAQHECNDVMQAASGLQTLVMLIQSELSEDDIDTEDINQLADAADTLVEFIQSELHDMRAAAEEDAKEDQNEPVPMAKAIELATLDDGEKIAIYDGYAMKAIADAPRGMVGGYLVKFGGAGDLSQFRDVFTKATNFGHHTKSDVWVHHRMLPGLGKRQLTNQAELGMDDEGVFVKHLLDLRNSYEAKLYGMVQDGKLGWSSGTAPHLVDRKSLGDGRHEVTQWTLGLDASYTPMPAGGFVVNAGAVKSIFEDAGIDLRDENRARTIALELDLLELTADMAG